MHIGPCLYRNEIETYNMYCTEKEVTVEIGKKVEKIILVNRCEAVASIWSGNDVFSWYICRHFQVGFKILNLSNDHLSKWKNDFWYNEILTS